MQVRGKGILSWVWAMAKSGRWLVTATGPSRGVFWSRRPELRTWATYESFVVPLSIGHPIGYSAALHGNMVRRFLILRPSFEVISSFAVAVIPQVSPRLTTEAKQHPYLKWVAGYSGHIFPLKAYSFIHVCRGQGLYMEMVWYTRYWSNVRT